MDWAVVATFAGIGVTAVLGALTTAREQSPFRQLERVTAVLKDTPSGTAGRESLEVLRDELAERILNGYRAPREQRGLILAWIGMLYGAGLLIAGPTMVLLAVNELFPGDFLPGWTRIVFGPVFFLLGVVMVRLSRRAFGLRQEHRALWVQTLGSQESAAPKL